MITALQVGNFRAFEEQRIEFAPITVLFGPNNSGKSALLSGLTVLAQTCRSPDPGMPLLLSGVYEDLGTYKDLVYNNHRRRKVRLRIEVDVPSASRGRSGQPTLPSSGGRSSSVAVDIQFRYRMQRREIVIEDLTIEFPLGKKLFHARYSDEAEKLMPDFIGRELEKGERLELARLGWTHFLPVGMLGVRRWAEAGKKQDANVLMLIDRVSRDVIRLLQRIEFIGPFRAAPSRTYLFSGETPDLVGRTGERAIDFLVADSARRGKRRLGIVESVSKWMARSGIAGELRVHALTDRHFELQASHLTTGEFQNLADVGYGCSQVLPILVAGYRGLRDRPWASRARAAKVLIVQEPEIHLHPRAQAELGDFFRDLALAGTQCIIETHSEHLLLRLQTHVASPSGGLTPDDVAVYYLHSPTAERKRAKRLRLNQEGIFIDEWPEGFFPERLREARHLAKEGMLRRKQGPADE